MHLIIKQGEKKEQGGIRQKREAFSSVSLFFSLFLPLFAADRSGTPKGLFEDDLNEVCERVLRACPGFKTLNSWSLHS